jgi:hypothetical protein
MDGKEGRNKKRIQEPEFRIQNRVFPGLYFSLLTSEFWIPSSEYGKRS